ncbi:hypothetical protein ACFWX0_41370, partial [Nonomuraea sp. NPDC059022]
GVAWGRGRAGRPPPRRAPAVARRPRDAPPGARPPRLIWRERAYLSAAARLFREHLLAALLPED